LTSIGGHGWVCGFNDATEQVVGVYGQIMRLSNPGLRHATTAIRSLWPLELGKSVQFNSPTSGGVEQTVRCTTTKQERVVVPAGPYETHVIRCVAQKNEGDQEFHGVYWYAPSLGFVVKQLEKGGTGGNAANWVLRTVKRVIVDKNKVEAARATIDDLLIATKRSAFQVTNAAKANLRPKDPVTLPDWVPPDTTAMVVVEEGFFPLGDRTRVGDGNEWNAKEIFLSAFRIDTYEVTNKEYSAFVAETGRQPARFIGYPELSRPYQPVVGVSWYDAAAFCEWEGKRLPTEFEWEKTARGPSWRTYPWGNEKPGAGGHWRANVGDRRFYLEGGHRYGADGFVFPAPVGSYPQGVGFFGAYDMSGNVWEWTSSNFDYDHYAKILDSRHPAESLVEGWKVARGGGWTSGPWSSRVTIRHAKRPGEAVVNLGFRCASDPGHKG
jgi:sulfatase modifying factor 1